MFLNSFNSAITLTIMVLLMLASMVWTNKSSTKPFMTPKPLLKSNKFM